jgi:hypothetical protein
MKKTLLIAGDSFSADWTKKYPGQGWVNMLSEYDVTNVSQAGVSEYKIYKQLAGQDLQSFDKVLVCHTSPFRIPILKHPVHASDVLHGNCDLIYNDISAFPKNKLARIATEFFENFFDEEYAEFTHALIVRQIQQLAPNAVHITFFDLTQNDIYSLHDVFLNHRGTLNHLDDQGNEIAFNIIDRLLIT